jgi:hypothetical protein
MVKYAIAVAAGLALALAAVLGIRWYGSHQYASGHAQAQLEAQAAAAKLSEQRRAQEQAAQEQADENYAKYHGQVLATQARVAGFYADDVGRLRKQIADLQSARAATHPATGTGADGSTGPDVIGAFAACAGRYDEVVQYAAGLADKVTGLQGYVRAALNAQAPAPSSHQ